MNAHCRYLAALTLAALSCTAAHAQMLVTPDEARRDQAAQAKGLPMPVAKSLPAPGAPRIEILAPNERGNLSSPFEIRVRFAADNGAGIVPDSFRVLYGMFGIDITSRVMQLAELKGDTLRIEKASIPAGKHRLTLKIKDSRQREGQVDLAVVVQD